MTRCADRATTRRFALRAYPPRTMWSRRGMYHAGPWFVTIGQLNEPPQERAGRTAVWRTRAAANRVARAGINHLNRKLEVVCVDVTVAVCALQRR